jgi:hypothetical protein
MKYINKLCWKYAEFLYVEADDAYITAGFYRAKPRIKQPINGIYSFRRDFLKKLQLISACQTLFLGGIRRSTVFSNAGH